MCLNQNSLKRAYDGEHGLQILGENAKDQRVKESLSILFTKSKL